MRISIIFFKIFTLFNVSYINNIFRLCRAACKDFPNFKGFKFDQQQKAIPQQQQQHQHQPLQPQQRQQHSEQPQMTQLRTANIQKFSSLGRRPLPQTPDEKARNKPPMPKVPTTISSTIETPLNPANFRSLQRGAWQDNSTTSTFQPNMQFRSLQRGAAGAQHSHSHSQFRSVKIQDQTQNESLYANNDNERQLYAVTEL